MRYTTNSMLDIMGLVGPINNAASPTFKIETKSYPPVNVITIDEFHNILEMACAGFTRDELEIVVENDELVVQGSKIEAEPNNWIYVQRGIAARSFRRTFKLAEYTHVSNAEYIDGILRIFIDREVPEEKKPKKIAISGGTPSGTKQLLTEGTNIDVGISEA